MNPCRPVKTPFLPHQSGLVMHVYGGDTVFSRKFSEPNNGVPGAGQLRQEINALGHSTFHEYDLQGREVYTWGPATYPVVQGYDAYGQRNLLRTFRDTNADFSSPAFPLNATGDTTTWTYDDATGALLQKTYADGKGPSYTYYADGLLKTRTWARKAAGNNPLVTTYTYTPLGQLSFIDYSDLTPDVTYTYNTLGQQITVTDGTGTRNFTYDPTTQALTQEIYTGTLNATLNRAYDHYTRPTGYALVDATGAAITTAATYTYDTTGNFSQVQGDTIPNQLSSSLSSANTTNLTPSTFTYNRVVNSDLISAVTGPVHTVTNTYEANRDVLTTKQNRVTTGPNANSIISQYDYTVNAIGQRTTRTQSGTAFDGIGYAPATQLPPTMTGIPNGGTTTDTFTYNPRGEVINSTNNQLLGQSRAYSYDPIGNRLATTEGDANNPATNPNAKIYTSNPLNQYTQINTTLPTPPTTAQPTYDDDGNMLTDGTGKTYTWDCENRLTQVTLPTNEIVHYAYDATSRRIQRQYLTPTNTTTTTYHYDAWNVIHEKTTHSNTIPESVTTPTETTHHWGLDLSNTLQGSGGVSGLLHSKTRTNDILTNHSYIYDANGNVSDLLDSTGATAAHFEYDPFGKELRSTALSGSESCYRFSTKPHDLIVGLTYYGFRFYAPSFGRWLNRDIINEVGGMNLCSMLANDLNNAVDYLGMECYVELKVPAHIVDPGTYPDNKWRLYAIMPTVLNGSLGRYFIREAEFEWRKTFYIGCKCNEMFMLFFRRDRCFNKNAERKITRTGRVGDGALVYSPLGSVGYVLPSGITLVNFILDISGVVLAEIMPKGLVLSELAQRELRITLDRLAPSDDNMGDAFVDENPCD